MFFLVTFVFIFRVMAFKQVVSGVHSKIPSPVVAAVDAAAYAAVPYSTDPAASGVATSSPAGAVTTKLAVPGRVSFTFFAGARDLWRRMLAAPVYISCACALDGADA